MFKLFFLLNTPVTNMNVLRLILANKKVLGTSWIVFTLFFLNLIVTRLMKVISRRRMVGLSMGGKK